VTRGPSGRRGWVFAASTLAVVVAAPIVAVGANLLEPRWDIWAHLTSTVLGELALNTLWLLLGVGIGTAILGTGLAWLVATTEFPGRRFFDWALLLPMAMPAYVVGFVVVGLLDYAGPIQTGLRETFGPAFQLPDPRSFPMLVIVMSLVLYPYPYLLARTAFAEQTVDHLEAARALGAGPWGAFRRVALPLARPAIVAGVTLAMLEALGDFGTVSTFGYRTFTTAIYRVWFGMFDRIAAGQLAAMLVVLAALVLLIERLARGRARFAQTHGRTMTTHLRSLRGRARWLAPLACAGVLLAGFVVPAVTLIRWTFEAHASDRIAANLGGLAWNSIWLATVAALLVVLAAVVLVYGIRLYPTWGLKTAARIATLGYAVPGSVAAVGVLLVLAAIDQATAWASERLLGRTIQLFLVGSWISLLFAYLVRFLAPGFQTVEAGVGRIRLSLDEAARGLGRSPSGVFSGIHLPLLRGSLLTALVLVGLDVMKEMPATLLIRPFGMDTLAVEIWQRTTESLWVEAAPPALAIVLAGLLPVALLTRLRRHPTV